MKMESKKTHLPIKHVESGKIFETYSEAAKSVNGNRWGVRYCAMGIQKAHMGQHFEYVRKRRKVK